MFIAGGVFQVSVFTREDVDAGQPAPTAIALALAWAVDALVVVVVVVAVAAVVVVVVVVVDLPEKSSAAEPITRTAAMATMTARRRFLRRFASRSICSIFCRRAAF